MSSLANRPFFKMNGIGNKIIVLDLRGSGLAVSPQEARAIGRGEGLHYDQLMVIHDPRRADTQAQIEIFNIDGSLAGACGNGTRCVAWVMMGNSAVAPGALMLESDAGLLECRRIGEWRFSVDMGAPRFAWNEIPLRDTIADTRAVTLPEPPQGAQQLGPFGAVSMGNPHAVFFVSDIAAHDLARLGPLIENHPMFPQRVNVSLAQVKSRSAIQLKVWERGTGLTQACGSAACATLAAAVRRDLTDRRATIHLPGGDLDIEWRESDLHVIMTGDVELEFQDRFAAGLFADARV
ncbi:MAG: diaminopimelate epimerase [Alphaproteobacteria bacterium]|nr:diaminopimelate epimerase [Alphaproteobacteria bacterium]